MGVEAVKLYREVMLELDTSGPMTLTISTELPGQSFTARYAPTVNTEVTTTGRRPWRIRLPYDLKGAGIKFKISGANTAILYHAKVYVRSLGAEAEWRWVNLPFRPTEELYSDVTLPIRGTEEPYSSTDLPIKPTIEEYGAASLPISPTAEEWSKTELPIDPTAEEYAEAQLPIKGTPEEFSVAALPITPTDENWSSTVLPIAPTEEGWSGANLPIRPTSEEWQAANLPFVSTQITPEWLELPIDAIE